MSTGAIHTFAKWQVKSGQLDKVLTTLATVARLSVQEEGDLIYEVYQSNDDENTILLLEGYTDEAALDSHRNSAHFKGYVIGEIIPLLENREVILTKALTLNNL